MSLEYYLIKVLLLSPAIFVLLGLFFKFEVLKDPRELQKNIRKTFKVVRDPNLPDPKKQKKIKEYSIKNLILIIKTALSLTLLLISSGLVYFLLAFPYYQGLEISARELLKLDTQVIIFLLAIIYLLLWQRIKKTRERPRDYTFTSRLLHNLILNNPLILKTSFDLESFKNKDKTKKINPENPVFVAGLARSGTTVLLKILYSSGKFASLTYRDMPLITAPGTWRKISSLNKLKSKSKQRAHGDNFLINYDSPEALEEIFWLNFSEKKYTLKDRLEPRESLPPELIKNYKKFISNTVINAQEKTESSNLRYLAKNNNNLLRLKALKEALPASTIIIPFRDPLTQASSLLNQHLDFIKKQVEDPFILKYMNWLGHFEFGSNLKPFNFNNDLIADKQSPENLNYWLSYWRQVYEYVLDNYEGKAVFLCYEKICKNPRDVLEKLEEKLVLEKGVLTEKAPELRPPQKYSPKGVEKKTLNHCRQLYQKLLQKSI